MERFWALKSDSPRHHTTVSLPLLHDLRRVTSLSLGFPPICKMGIKIVLSPLGFQGD